MNPKKVEKEKEKEKPTKKVEKEVEKEKKKKKKEKKEKKEEKKEEKKGEKKEEKKEENKEEKKDEKEVPPKKSKLTELLEAKNDENETKKKKPKTKKPKEKKQKREYTLDFIMNLKDTKFAQEDLLLSKEVKSHFEKFNKEDLEIKKIKSSEFEKPFTKGKYKEEIHKDEKSSHKTKTKKEESKAEEEFKKAFNEALKDKSLEEKLNYYLDKINPENYDFVRKEILELIKDNKETQDKFVDAVIKISIMKAPFSEIYAKLCKNLDKDLQHQSSEEDKKKEHKKESSLMKTNLIDKARLLFTSEQFEETDKDAHKYEKQNKLKKNMIGITYFLIELIKLHILSKKVVPTCFQNLFSKYEKSKKDQILKNIYIEAIIIFTEEFEKMINSQKSKMNEKEEKEYTDSINEIFKKLEIIKDEVTEKYIKHKIMNLIEKRKNDYQKTKFELYLEQQKLKKETQTETGNKFCQDVINDRIEKGLSDYINFVEKEGSSDKYEWIDETFLIEKKGQSLDDILEGYFMSCVNTFENDIKHAKNYIKELIEYYIGQKTKKEKADLKDRLIKIFEIVKNDIPTINQTFSHAINIFLENDIMKITDLESIADDSKKLSKEELTLIDKILKDVNENSSDKKLKKEIAKINFVEGNKEIFKWLFE